MKRILLVAFVLCSMIWMPKQLFAQSEDELLDICGAIAGSEATYLRDFKIRLDAADPAPIQRYPVVLKKGNRYRFAIASSKDFDGAMKLELFDSNRLMATTNNPATGADYPSFDYICTKTGPYHLFFSFKDGKAGMGVGVLSLLDGEN